MNKNVRNGLITLAVGAVLWFLPAPAGLNVQGWHLFAIFVATILGFILTPLPIGAVALISLAISGTLGVLKPAEALAGFGNSVMWLIISAFIFAKGFVKTRLGLRIAYKIMAAIGDSSLKMAYALALSDLVVSPATPSNTARAGGILYPIVRSLSVAFGSEPGETSRKIGAFLMKSTFQVNCVTSCMFLTSMAPNSLIAALALKTVGVNISWGTWALAAIVPGLVGLAITPYVIYKLYPPELKHTPEAKVIANQELAKLGPMTYGEKVVSGTFVIALLLWSTASFTKLDATFAAMLCVGLMLVGKAIEWQDVIEEKSAWDTLFWMGGLISLAGALSSKGVIAWLSKIIGASLVGYSWEMALGILILAYMYSHYFFASLSAHVTAMYAAFVAVAAAAGAPPFLAALSIGIISGLMGTLTHYATGPSPIYFGSGYVPQGTWWGLGFIMSVINMAIFLGIGGIWWKILGFW